MSAMFAVKAGSDTCSHDRLGDRGMTEAVRGLGRVSESGGVVVIEVSIRCQFVPSYAVRLSLTPSRGG